MSITIDKEFESLIPPLSAEEFQQLEENCLRDGIRDALIVWEQDGKYFTVSPTGPTVRQTAAPPCRSAARRWASSSTRASTTTQSTMH